MSSNSQNLVLETNRLILHPADRTHAALLTKAMQDPRLTTYLAWAPHHNEEETARVLDGLHQAGLSGTGYHWTIFFGNEACGLVSLIDVKRHHRLWELQRAEIAYWVAVDWQNRGIATEAVKAVVNAGFSHFGLSRLIISQASENSASARIPQTLGFRYVGQEHHFFSKGGKNFDMNHHEMLRHDWLARSESK